MAITSKQRLTPKSRLSGVALYPGIVLLLVFASGCIISGNETVPDRASNPRVFSIGRQAILSFDRKTPLTIPVEGRNLYDSLRHHVEVSFVGTRSITPDDYEVQKYPSHSGGDILRIILKTNYLARIETGNTLDIAVHMREYTGFDGALAEINRIMTPQTNSGNATISEQDADSVVTAVEYLRLRLETERNVNGKKWLQLSNSIQALFEPAKRYRDQLSETPPTSTNATPPKADAGASKLSTNMAPATLYRAIRAHLPEIRAALLLCSEDSTIRDLDVKERAIYTASRTFTFYEYQSYQDDYESKRVSPANIMAFPLPNEEAKKLFSKRIADNYFVVRLSVRNTEAEDRLISSGMIRARGRAIVQKNPPFINTVFTVPVEVSPHSLQQVYAVLTDTASDTTRAILFRSLEFAGAIASAYTLGFNASETTKDAVQLATGVGIPGLKELYTDKEPGYRRNLVNFGMEDLVKVSKGSVTSHKFLFFPKKAIEGLVIDQLSYSYAGFTGGTFKPPVAQIAYLIVDNMEIPFENVFQAEPADIRTRVLELKTDIEDQMKRLDGIRKSWRADDTNSVFEGNLRLASFLTDSNAVTAALVKKQKELMTLAATNELVLAVATFVELAAAFQPEAIVQGILFENYQDLDSLKFELEEIQHALSGGMPASRYEKTIKEAKSLADKNRLILGFYSEAAKLLSDQQTIKTLLDATENLPKDVKNKLTKLGELRGSGLRDKLFPNLEFFDAPPPTVKAAPTP